MIIWALRAELASELVNDSTWLAQIAVPKSTSLTEKWLTTDPITLLGSFRRPGLQRKSCVEEAQLLVKTQC